jgi:hypothetical protein
LLRFVEPVTINGVKRCPLLHLGNKMTVHAEIKETTTAAAAFWEEGGEFAAHVAAVKKALGPERVKQLTSGSSKAEEVVKQLISLPGLKVERQVVNKDKEVALQFKEQGNDLFRWVRGKEDE